MQCLDMVDRVSWKVLSSIQDEREWIKYPTNMPEKKEKDGPWSSEIPAGASKFPTNAPLIHT